MLKVRNEWGVESFSFRDTIPNGEHKTFETDGNTCFRIQILPEGLVANRYGILFDARSWPDLLRAVQMDRPDLNIAEGYKLLPHAEGPSVSNSIRAIRHSIL